jgi:hypothetical protein
VWRIYIGAALIVAGIAAFIEAHGHAPEYICTAERTANERIEGSCPAPGHFIHFGLSQTPYDVLRIGAWALVIFGAVLLIVGLIGYWRKAAT